MTPDAGTAFLGVLLLAVSMAWVLLFVQLLRGREILRLEPRREPPWGAAAVVVSFVLLIGLQLTVASVFGLADEREPTVSEANISLAWLAVATLGAAAISAFFAHLCYQADWCDLGLVAAKAPRDVCIGVTAFLVLGPVAYGIQFIFVYAFQFESHHPLIELLSEDKSNQLFGMVALMAVIVAPLAEEFIFRVLLQGWLERLTLYGVEPDERTQDAAEGRSLSFAAPAAECQSDAADDNPYQPPQATEPLTGTRVKRQRQRASIVPGLVPAALPIAGSSFVFALMHYSHGPDPAALFVFALGLGWVYQRTHRLLPCVVMHFCLNATTMALLWFGLDELSP